MAFTTRLSEPAQRLQWGAAALLVLGCAATVGTALLFEHVGGYIPCALCLEQRVPYYLSVPLAALALASLAMRAPAWIARGLMLVVGLAMLYGLGLAVYHSGVEWHFWKGPADCVVSGGADLTGDLLSTIDAIKPPACDQAAGRFLGLSFAGWNVLASLLFAGVALIGAFARPKRA